jgi:cytochrome b pre-mRNA-processing protein 3
VFLGRLFSPKRGRSAGRSLYEAAVVQARRPAFYTALGAPDTPEGRFELYTLHVVLLLHRLRRQGAQAAETTQALFDAYVQGLDDGLREMGVGDLSVGRKMRGLAAAFYGRARAYEAALGDDDNSALTALAARTLYAGVDDRGCARLVDYIGRCVTVLQAVPMEAVMEGRLAWPEVAP